MELIKGKSYTICIPVIDTWEDKEHRERISHHALLHNVPVIYQGRDENYFDDESHIFVPDIPLYDILQDQADYEAFLYLIHRCFVRGLDDDKWQIHIIRNRFDAVQKIDKET